MADQSERIVAAYQDVEAWLLREVARAVARGADGTAEHYQERLGEIQLLLTNTDRRLELVEKDALEWVAETIASGFDEGGQQALSTIPDGVPPAVPASAVASLAAETSAALASQRPTILRSVQDAYRQITQQVTTRAVVSGASINTIMQDALDHFANQGITSFTDKAGRKFGIDTYTRMALRTARNRALNEGRRESFQTNGVQLIQTSWHMAPAPVCEPYQARILSLDGQAGDRTEIDRVTGEEITVHVTATLEEAEANGYHHPNCAHVDTAYIPGMPVPEPPEVDPEDYEQSQRQRQIERHIRHWKKRELVAVTPQAKAQAAAKVKAWQAAQRAHIKANPFLRRNYAREKLWTGQGGNAILRTPPKPKPAPPTRASIPTSFYEQQVQPAGKVDVGGANRGYTLGTLNRTTDVSWESITTAANPGYLVDKRTYGVNCIRVSATAELRRRGYDVTAGPANYNPNNLLPETQAHLRSVIKERSKTAPKNRKVSVSTTDVAMTAWRTKDDAVRLPQMAEGAKKGLKGGQNAATLDLFENGVPDGATGFAEGHWKSGGAHIWNWTKEGGEIKFFEAQTHEGFRPRKEYMDKIKAGTFKMVRVDDLEPTDDILRVIDYDANRSFWPGRRGPGWASGRAGGEVWPAGGVFPRGGNY